MSATAPAYVGDKIYCPNCAGYFKFMRVHSAARLTVTSRRSIYRYIELGSVFALRIAGHTLRICSGCLLKPVE